MGARSDISFAVGNVSRHMEKPALVHVNAVKRILKYIKETTNIRIGFEGGNRYYLVFYIVPSNFESILKKKSVLRESKRDFFSIFPILST